ncbi:MAG: efflux RND transporter permease subunit [Acidobacteria bacterium]|nr:efflux RND transporter permease subunit [Acidobacteriota bacterium]
MKFTESWVDACLKHRLLVVLAALFAACVGAWSLTRLKIEAYPDISDLQVTIVTLYPGHAPEEVEQQITVPLERTMNTVPGVVSRRSRTIFGLSVVDLTFGADTQENLARQAVMERLHDVELPDGVTATLAPPVTPAGELYRYVLRSDTASEMTLRELQDWVVAPRFQQAPGVGDVVPFGGLIKQYQVEIDPLALYKYDLRVQDVADRIKSNNQNAGGSLLATGEEALVVRGIGMLRSPEDIENVVLKTVRGTAVFVRDVAKVKIGAAPPAGVFGLDSISGGVEGIVVMRRGENPTEVLKGILAAVTELNTDGLPAGVRVEPIYDRTELVENTLRTVSRTLAEALAIVLFVSLFFLGSLRAALVTVVVIPLSLAFAFGCMWLCGVPASLLSLGALDFGIIVDGTLVMAEAIVSRMPESVNRDSGQTVATAVRKASGELGRSIIFSLIILIAAYLPLFTLERVESRLFSPMAFTICAALLGSMISTLTLTPVLATVLFRNGSRAWRNPVAAWIVRRYETDLSRSLRHPWPGAIATVAILAAGAWLGSRMGSEFLPTLDEGVMWLRANLPPGISLEKSVEVAGRMRAAIRRSPEIHSVTSQTGRQESNTEPFGPNRNEFLIVPKPYSEWAPGKTKADLVAELSARLQREFPSAALNFSQPIMDMVMESVTGSSADLAVILTGRDMPELRKLGLATLDVLKDIPGAADTSIEQESEQPQLKVEIRRDDAARYGVNVSEVQDVVEMAIGGRAISTLFDGERRFDIAVRYHPAARSTLSGIGAIVLKTPDGGRAALSQLAAIRIEDGATTIARRENRRQISVRTNIRGRDQGSFVREAQRRMREKVPLPEGYRAEWGGVFENLDRARRRLMYILPVTVLIIFGLLYWAFGSVRNSLLVLVNVPFSIVGGVAALYLRDIPFSVSAAVGFVSLFGVAVMSGVLYVMEMDQQRKSGRALPDAVREGAVRKMRPCLILILVAMLAMAPAATARGIGSDIQRPLATVVFGGLVSTLVLTLFALPALYLLAHRRESGR